MTADNLQTTLRPVSLSADEALNRCAAGELAPEIALTRLLSETESEEQREATLGSAIWDALESRDSIRAERLAQVHRLWNRLRQTVHNTLHSL